MRRGGVLSEFSSITSSFRAVGGGSATISSMVSCPGSVTIFGWKFVLVVLCGELLRLGDGDAFLLRLFGLTSCHWPSVLMQVAFFSDKVAESLKNITSSYSISDASQRSGSCSFRNGMVFSVTRLRRVGLTVRLWSLL